MFIFSVMSKEAQLFQVPENINVKSNIMKSEEMLSSQMLSGIPEVDLGESFYFYVQIFYVETDLGLCIIEYISDIEVLISYLRD